MKMEDMTLFDLLKPVEREFEADIAAGVLHVIKSLGLDALDWANHSLKEPLPLAA